MSQFLQVIRALLIKLRIISPSVEESYMAFLQGFASSDLLFRYLRIDQVDEFIKLHLKVKKITQGICEGISKDVLLSLLYLLKNNPKRLQIGLNQIDRLIEDGLEENILRKKGKNVVHRQSDI